MKPAVHRIYIGSMVVLVLAALAYLSFAGYDYYRTPLEERFTRPDHNLFSPSGVLGHGYGIIGSLFMLIGVATYMMRKRMRSMARFGKLKHWLEFHIFLCVLGPLFVLFHTSFKIGGLVSVSFWSMVAVFLSGIVGRFIYIRIPRSIEGRELSLGEIRDMKGNIGRILETEYALDPESIETILKSTRTNITPNPPESAGTNPRDGRKESVQISRVRALLKQSDLSRERRAGVMRLVKKEISLNRRIEGLQRMQNLFKYWHLAHLPFALLMLIIMVIHVAVTVILGYRWIFGP